ncbi:MAG: hypothetical protein KY466_02190 [Gemmatimonadetes bacterium]|nr:hypothetical protein [Gemmatimonadota bacterium]
MHALVIALFALTLAAPRPADALQGPRPPVRTVAHTVGGTPDAADRLAEEAYRLFADRRSWGKAARMLERSAGMRDAADPERAEAFREAGRVYAHVGAQADARRALEAAAAAAFDRGAVVVAAHSLLDAAIVAARAGDRDAAAKLLRKASLLADSPHIDMGDRAGILERVEPEGARG